MTVKQLAEYLQINEKLIYRLIKEKDLPGFRLGYEWRFKKSDIDKWIEKRKKESKKE